MLVHAEKYTAEDKLK